jgi:molybdopterin molybdotransferase
VSGLLGLEEAQARLLALAPALRSESVPATWLGPHRYFARDHEAVRTQPAADLSAMDGYALCGAGPWELVGESRAGAPFAGELGAGECTRISTGAHMPRGADRVLIQEEARREGTRIVTDAPPAAGRHVRKAGFDFAHGDTVLRKGDALTPACMALAIAAGLAEVEVGRPPRIAVLDSGDELVPPGEEAAPHQLPASNGAMIAAMLAPHAGEIAMIGPVADSREALAAALHRAEDCDILITSGGASVGDHDLVQDALRDWGAEIDFWKVAVRPGKPLMVARREPARGGQVILGLPGNPVSSFVTAFLFALPLVRRAMGARDPLPVASPMAAAEALPAGGTRREFLRAVSEDGRVRLAGSQDSSALVALARADCLIDHPAGAPAVAPGETVSVYNLRNG